VVDLHAADKLAVLGLVDAIRVELQDVLLLQKFNLDRMFIKHELQTRIVELIRRMPGVVDGDRTKYIPPFSLFLLPCSLNFMPNPIAAQRSFRKHYNNNILNSQ